MKEQSYKHLSLLIKYGYVFSFVPLNTKNELLQAIHPVIVFIIILTTGVPYLLYGRNTLTSVLGNLTGSIVYAAQAFVYIITLVQIVVTWFHRKGCIKLLNNLLTIDRIYGFDSFPIKSYVAYKLTLIHVIAIISEITFYINFGEADFLVHFVVRLLPFTANMSLVFLQEMADIATHKMKYIHNFLKSGQSECSTITMFRLDDVIRMNKLYAKLERTVEQINHCYGIIFIVLAITIITLFIGSVNVLIILLRSDKVLEEEWVGMVLWNLTLAGMIYQIPKNCGKVSDECEKTSLTALRLFSKIDAFIPDFNMQRTRKELKSLYKRTRFHPLKITSGYFDINQCFTVTIISIVTTYTIVILQLTNQTN